MKKLLWFIVCGLALAEGLAAEPGVMLGLGPLAALGITAGTSLLSGILGSRNARRQAQAIERANEPKPFWQRDTREPWGPAANPLQEAILEAMAVHRRRVNAAPPPRISTAGITGPSSQLRALAEAMRERAMTSQFIPSAQARALEMMSRPNPMVAATFQRASNYSNPLLEMLQARAMSTGGGPGAFNSVYAPMTDFLENLLAGQRTLGVEPERD